jgi:hypothetical protein
MTSWRYSQTYVSSGSEADQVEGAPTVWLLVAILVSSYLLLRAGWLHLRGDPELAETLARYVPARWTPVAGRALGGLEVGAGLLMLAAMARTGWAPTILIGCVVALMGIGFSVHQFVGIRSHSGAPCGCGAADTPASWAGLMQASCVALGGVAMIVSGPDGYDGTVGQWAVGVVSGLVLGSLIYELPGALRPGRIPLDAKKS